MLVERHLAGKQLPGASSKNSSYLIIQLAIQRLTGHSSEADGDSFSQSCDQHCVHFVFSEVSIERKCCSVTWWICILKMPALLRVSRRR